MRVRSACGSEVSVRGVVSSVAQEYRSEVLLGSVALRGVSEMSLRSVAEKCGSDMCRNVARTALRSVAQASLKCVCVCVCVKGSLEVLLTSVACVFVEASLSLP